MIPCGHSFCSECLKLLFKPSTHKLSCPTCLSEHNITNSINICEQFTKNFALLALVDSNDYSREPLLQMKMGLSMSRRLSSDLQHN